MCTVLLPPGVNPIAVNKNINIIISRTHKLSTVCLVHTSVKGNFGYLLGVITVSGIWKNLGTPPCFNIIPILVYWWNRPCKFNAKAYSFPTVATAPICSYSLHWQRFFFFWSCFRARTAFDALFDIVNSLIVHPVRLSSANAETAIQTDVCKCCTLLLSCSGPGLQFVFLRVSHT